MTPKTREQLFEFKQGEKVITLRGQVVELLESPLDTDLKTNTVRRKEYVRVKIVYSGEEIQLGSICQCRLYVEE